MRALRGVLAFIASAVVVAACVLTMSSSPVATAADSTSIEAESMGVSPASAGATVTDKSASQGVALVLRSPATASKTLTLPASATIVVRARGQSCGAAPVMNVAVDGKTISTTKVSSSSWASYTTAISIPAGNHVIGVILTNRRGSYFCQVNLYVDTVTVVASAPTSTTTTTTTTPSSTTTTTTTTTPTTPTSTVTSTSPVPAARFFTGDYSTGNFSQWPAVHNRYVNQTGAYYDRQGYTYPATIVTDSAKGRVGRFEVRSGDPGIYQVGGSPRSEVATAFNMPDMTEGKVNWQSLSVNFDPSFPTTASDAVWAVTNQWHAYADGSPPLSLVCVENGQWTLRVFKWNNTPGNGGTATVADIWSTPLTPGVWHDVKMQIGWSTSDTVGFVRLWHNGVAQTFANGQTTYYTRTLMPNGGNNYYKEGLYRADRTATGVVYHSGYRFASTESGL